ncbi:hypothetical protein GSI_07986 [Ganoderma sinense ZZ0214-1]|uniref:Uncharacterized protein n=1 Tax=Ganoderma sinense ZZ0214-1 TaxID=1077348 RepID=A0A2G8S7P5_9APHY|nr:hypothetical protein GSI_07986 [Ganoderma sinense ZZ0214-1]
MNVALVFFCPPSQSSCRRSGCGAAANSSLSGTLLESPLLFLGFWGIGARNIFCFSSVLWYACQRSAFVQPLFRRFDPRSHIPYSSPRKLKVPVPGTEHPTHICIVSSSTQTLYIHAIPMGHGVTVSSRIHSIV